MSTADDYYQQIPDVELAKECKRRTNYSNSKLVPQKQVRKRM